MGAILRFCIVVAVLHVSLLANKNQEVSAFSFGSETNIKELKQEKSKSGIRDLFESAQGLEKKPVKETSKDEFQAFSPKTLFVSYKDIPLSGYVGELIPLSVRVIVTEKFDDIKVRYDSSKGKIFEFNSSWRKDSENTYEKTIYFQPKVPMKNLPKFNVKIVKNGKVKDFATLEDVKLDIVKLINDDGRFIDVIAKDLIVKRFKTTQFSESALIMVMEIKTVQASINNIKFNNVIKQGLDSKSGVFPDLTLYYFIVFKNDTSSINFSYFNTALNKYEIINLPVVVEQDDLSTQIGLNPKKSKFELYKDVGIGVCIILFLGLFLYYRKYIFALLAVCLCVYLFYVRGTTTLMVNAGSKIRILPTEKSTIFYTISSPMQVEELNRVGSYIKILLPNKKIGWIKKEDVSKN